MELSEILTKYGVPDPKIVGKLPKGNVQLDFVGHADTQKALTEIDPTWSMEPVAFDSDGLPAYRVENGMAHMACWMTLLGVRRLGIGSVMHNKPDLLKELLSDAIRNCAMRHNVYLSLWTKSEWDDVDNHKPAPANKPVPKTAPAPTTDGFISNEQRQQLQAACAKAGIAPEVMAQNAGLDWNGDIKDSDIPALRAAFKELKEFKKGA